MCENRPCEFCVFERHLYYTTRTEHGYADHLVIDGSTSYFAQSFKRGYQIQNDYIYMFTM